MLLGALVGAGVPLERARPARSPRSPPSTSRSTPETVSRNGFAATRCTSRSPTAAPTAAGATSRRCSRRPALPDAVRERARGRPSSGSRSPRRPSTAPRPTDVHFHEVGALDAIADVVGVCAGLVHLGLDELVVSAVAVGSGRVRGAHGEMPVPPPAVAELLRGVPSYAGPGERELCTPTGAALLTSHATSYGAQPAMTVREHRRRRRRPRPVHPRQRAAAAGRRADRAGRTATAAPLVLESNIDDLDPRLWPNVIAALLAAGASDAWLTPIVMKKGRPAHTLSALVAADRADGGAHRDLPADLDDRAARDHDRQDRAGPRMRTVVGRRAPDPCETCAAQRTRRQRPAGVRGRVRCAAATSGRPAKEVLADAVAASRHLVDEP